jgi:PAS domain S-box-containing protein
LLGFIAIQRDISERKKAEKQIKIEKAYLEQLFESAPEAIVVVDNDGKIIRINSEFTGMFGYTAEEALGCSIDKLLAPGELHEEAQTLTKSVCNGRTVSCEVVRYRKDRTAVDVSILGTPIDAGEGQIAVYGIYRDITERKKSEEALRKSERFLKDVFDGIQDGICVLDSDLNIVHVNKTMEKWYPHALPLLGRKCYQAFHNRDAPCESCPTIRAIKTGQLQSDHAPLIEQGNIKGWLELFAYPLADDKGRITGIIEYARDITSQQKAEDLNEARAGFLAKLVGLTHATELAQLTFEHIANQMPVDAGGLVVKTDEFGGNKFEIVYSMDVDERGQKTVATKRELLELNPASATSRVYHSGQMEIVHRTEGDLKNYRPTTPGIFTFNDRPSLSLIFLPLKIHGQIIGVLSVQSYELNTYSDKRVAVLESIAADLALALTAVRMTEALTASEERYRIVAEQTGQIIYDFDVKSGRIAWSGAIQAITGYTVEEFKNIDIDSWAELVHPDDRPTALRLLDEAMQSRSRYHVEYRMRCKDGSYIYVEDNGVFLQNDSVAALRMLGTMNDITKHRQAKELLLQSEEKYRRLIETMPNGLAIADMEENIVFANPMASAIFGYSLEELVEMNLISIVDISDMSRLLDETSRRKSGQYTDYELQIRRKDGQLRTIFVTAAPLFDGNNKAANTIAIFNDITELKNSEAEKIELREKLARAQKMESLGVLAGGVAHDLNNILGPLVAYPELIRMKLPPESPVIKQISKIESSAQRAAEVVQDLLTMARRGRYEMVPLDLNRVVESYLLSPDYYELKLRFPRVEVISELDARALPIYGSSPHLYKVVMNLVQNAMDAMPDGGELRIKTKTSYIDKLVGGYDNIECGMYTILTVNDTGIGIDTKDYKRLFEPFYTKKEMGRSGSGLGLAIVYGVVKDHNGYIDVRSELDIGSDFILYFPSTKDHAQIESLAGIDIRGSEKILIVDDVIEQRELAATVLGCLGYHVWTAANGHEAIDYLKANEVDAVILDMIMEPGFDGLDTYREIIKIRPGQKAIITSGFSETDRVKEAEGLGVGRYIRKPYTMQKLGKAIREILDSRNIPIPTSNI